MIKLNLGCGNKKYGSGFVNGDYRKECFPDLLLDLEKFPYPWKDNSVDVVVMEHSWEHLWDYDKAIKEVYRILKKGGLFILITPHYSFSWSHPDHHTGANYHLTSIFKVYYDCYFENKEKPRFNYTRLKSFPIYQLGKVLTFFANLYPEFCERIWCYWFGGFEEIYFTMVKKDKYLKSKHKRR